MTLKTTLKGAAAALAVMAGTTAVSAEEITVGYFLEWPMPFQYAKAEGMYDEAMGVTVNWVSFDTGTAMSAAMASGDVQMSVSQGVPPFVVMEKQKARRRKSGGIKNKQEKKRYKNKKMKEKIKWK